MQIVSENAYSSLLLLEYTVRKR